MPHHVLDRVFQFVEREVVAQRGHHLVGQGAVDPQFDELEEEEGLLIEGVGHNLRGLDEPGRFVHPDPVLGVEHAGAERDRRDVALAGGPQAEDEPDPPLGQARLVRRKTIDGLNSAADSRGIFLGEGGPDQQATALADRLIGEDVAADLVKR